MQKLQSELQSLNFELKFVTTGKYFMLYINISAYNKLGPDVFKSVLTFHIIFWFIIGMLQILFSEIPKHTI